MFSKVESNSINFRKRIVLVINNFKIYKVEFIYSSLKRIFRLRFISENKI